MRIPDVTITAMDKITIRRTLPQLGQLLVKQGQKVQPLQIIARTQTPCRYQVIDIARLLSLPNLDIRRVLQKKVGDYIQADEIIATVKGTTPFMPQVLYAPSAGYIAAIVAGLVLLETERAVIETQAFINGLVAELIPNRGVVIETYGTVIEAACGFGGEAYGRLKSVVNSPLESVKAETLNENLRETIILGGCSIDEEALRKADRLQIRGVIVGSIDASLLNLSPPVKVRVVATEGFGNIPISARAFSILTSLKDNGVSIRGQTPALSPPSQQNEPPIIFATSAYTDTPPTVKPSSRINHDIKKGDYVRITRGSLLGSSGLIDSLPTKPQLIPSGIVTPVAYVKVGETLPCIPLANLERVSS